MLELEDIEISKALSLMRLRAPTSSAADLSELVVAYMYIWNGRVYARILPSSAGSLEESSPVNWRQSKFLRAFKKLPTPCALMEVSSLYIKSLLFYKRLKAISMLEPSLTGISVIDTCLTEPLLLRAINLCKSTPLSLTSESISYFTFRIMLSCNFV